MSFPIKLFATIMTIGATGAVAAEVSPSITLRLGETGSISSQNYTCPDGKTLSVQYVNSGVNSFAILPVDGVERIFVAVISGSGVRYVSGPYTWWTKGKTAMLENVMTEHGTINCAEQS